ncbi:MAG: phosphodiester glycosidase family protein [Armatimonadetes bacterium]|nr:phosphodiester glycosidase family protein [Armatimonadota bacterium]
MHASRLIAAAFLPFLACVAGAQHVGYEKRQVNGLWFHAVIVNLNSENVKVTGVIARTPGRTEALETMLARSNPTAAVCGTFFDTRTNFPVGDIVIEGRQVAEGLRGSCLVVDYFNRARILDTKQGEKVDWSRYRFVLRAGVRILNAGKMYVYPQAQGFRDSRVWGNARRTAVGITPNNKLILLVTDEPAQLRDLVSAMKVFGARDAIALDGGGSALLYYRDRLLVQPRRRLTNILLIYEAPGAAWSNRPGAGQ